MPPNKTIKRRWLLEVGHSLLKDICSIPGWDDHDDDTQKFDKDVKISAWAIFSPEEEHDRDVQTTILTGGVGVNHMMLKIVSKDSGWGNQNDPFFVIVYGQ